jgi:hypothetical protein
VGILILGGKMINDIILIDIDCLMDTRLGVIHHINESIAKKFLLEGMHTRIEDRFPGIDEEEFKRTYKNRNKNILKNTTSTGFFLFIIDFIDKTIYNTLGTPHEVRPKLLINLHPYDFTEAEKEELIKTLTYLSDSKIPIDVINISDEDLSPVWLKEKVLVFAKYHYQEWLEIHSESKDNLMDNPIPHITLLGPKIYFGEKPEDDEIDSGFREIELFSAPFVNLILLESEVFTTIIKFDKKE